MKRRQLLGVLGVAGTGGCLRITDTEATEQPASGSEQPPGTERSEATTASSTDSPLLTDTETLALRWEGPSHSSGIALGDEQLYVDDDGLVALSRSGGIRRWQPASGEHVRSFRVDRQELLFTTEDGTVGSIDLTTRSERWRYSGTELDTPPRVGPETVVVGEEDGDGGAVVCLERADGTERWRVETDQSVSHLSPPAENAVVFGTTGGPDVRCHDLTSGEQRWFSEESHPSMAPRLADGVAYVPTAFRVLAFDLAEGAIRWDVDIPSEIERFGAGPFGDPPVFRDGRLSLPAGGGGLVSITADSRGVDWSYAVPASAPGAVQLHDGHLWLATDRTLHRVDAATGEGTTVGRIGSEQRGVTGLAVADGTLFISSFDTPLRAFDIVR